MPSDLLRVVAQKVRGIELPPKALLDAVGERIEPKQARRLRRLLRKGGIALERRAGQDLARGAEQIL
jgi:hypothetical protein